MLIIQFFIQRYITSKFRTNRTESYYVCYDLIFCAKSFNHSLKERNNLPYGVKMTQHRITFLPYFY